VITGFNTDIPFEGVTYHVQTEDKGLETPLILSLVYVGGAIIASKRTPYQDLVEAGFDEKALTERLQRQHKLICAAIRAGRVEDLKRMGERDGGAQPEAVAGKKRPAPSSPKGSGAKKRKSEAADAEAKTGKAQVLTLEAEKEAGVEPAGSSVEFLTSVLDEISALTSNGVIAPAPAFQTLPHIAPAIHEELAGEASADLPPPPDGETTEAIAESSDELYLSLVDDEGDFRAGQLATIKIHVGRGSYGRRPVSDASVTVKVLGTTFRPLILSTTTDVDGIAVLRALLPRFTSGRAAIIIRAVAADDATELRRIIHQS
jgi:hypothetical protein